MPTSEDESNDNSLDSGMDSEGGRPSGHDEMSLGGGATYAGGQRSRLGMSLGDEGTLGDKFGDQEAVIDDIEVIDLEKRYKVEKTLGRGGMGEVLLAVDTRLERKVAIKRISGESARNKTAVDRFLAEAKSIAKIGDHPNIIQIYEYGRAKDGPFLTMEYVEGGNLLDRCRDGALPLEEAIDLTCQLCDGLAKAHDAGIVHRDIKPANVLLTTDSVPKLTDFGLAKAEASDHQMTMTGAVLGTPDFMPPEQRRNAAEVDTRSDLWSLAATLYQMVTGRSPKIIRFRDVPAGLEEVLGRALEEQKDARYQSASEFRDALKASLSTTELATADLGEGQCGACGVKNESSRRFCRGCGESLEVPCLSCTKPMPMWEEICGQCGSKQTPLVEQRRAELAVKQSEAESLLKEHRYEEAEQVATTLRDESDPRLKQLVPWATELLPQIAQQREAELFRVGSLLQQALKHEASYDYSSAVNTLAFVPESLQQRALPGCSEIAASVIARVLGKQDEVKRQEELVNQRVKRKQFDGLIAEVDKLVALRPDRKDVLSLQTKLRNRDKKRLQQRDDLIQQAKGFLAARDYESAIAVLRKVEPPVITDEVTRLRSQAENLQAQLRSLLQDIKQARSEKRFDGLMDTVKEAMAIAPEDDGLTNFLASLELREDKIAAKIVERVVKSDEAFSECDYKTAFATLAAIPEDRRSEEVEARICLVENLGELRGRFMDTVAGLPIKNQDLDLAKIEGIDLGQIAREGRRYLAEAETHNLVDQEVIHWCEKLEAAVEKKRAEVVLAEKFDKQKKRVLTAVGALIVVWALVGIRSARQASKLEANLAAKQWNAALRIDPENAEAFLGLARDKLTEIPPDVDAAFEYLNRAAHFSGNVSFGASVRGQAHAQRAVLLAEADNLVDAAADYLQAKKLGWGHAMLTPAGNAIGKAWLIRGEAARDKSDASGVSAAIEQAGTYQLLPADTTLLRTLTEQTLGLQARVAFAGGKTTEAIRLLDRAVENDFEVMAAMLNAPRDANLKAAYVSTLEKKVDEAFQRKDWESGLIVAAVAVGLDSAANSWSAEKVAACISSLNASEIESLPPALIAVLPQMSNSIGLKLKLIPAGTFTMGDAKRESDETPHEVTLTQPFYLGVTEVTNAQWKTVMGNVPSNWKDDDLPVEQVSWEDAVSFCKKLSSLPTERAAGRVYRLPTEAEWEYSCRAGTSTEYSFGNEESLIGDFAWFDGNSEDRTHPVGQKQPNAWGLYDMHGNVWEWCSDWYGDYSDNADSDPYGPSSGSRRIGRGGSWHAPAGHCRSAARAGFIQSSGYFHVGFRVALSPSDSRPPEAEVTSERKPGGSPSERATGVAEAVGGSMETKVDPLPPDAPETIENSIGIKIKPIPAGTFTMGEGDSAHRVTLTEPFYLGMTEVTNASWWAVMANFPSNWKDDDFPVEQVSWEDAVSFCEKLSLLPAERAAGRVYRLPTEAEWEYACRAGTTTEYSFGDDESLLGNFAWFSGNAGIQTHPVGQKQPNAWGLYDMHGNVWEWCSDWNDDYPRGSVTNPRGPASGSRRVYRGGSWNSSARGCRSASRGRFSPSGRDYLLGFRLALSSSGSKPLEAEK